MEARLAGRIALPGVRDPCHNPQADQDQDAYSDPLRRNMRQMRSHSQASD